MEKTVTTIIEETMIKKRKIDGDNTLKHNFDLSARKFIDWMDSIERILDDKQSTHLKITDRQEIIQVNEEDSMKNTSFMFVFPV